MNYSYEVESVSYEGDKISMSESSVRSWSRAQKMASGYPKGGNVRVFYDPDDPQTSVLVTGLNASIWVMPGLGLCSMMSLAVTSFLEHTATSSTPSISLSDWTCFTANPEPIIPTLIV